MLNHMLILWKPIEIKKFMKGEKASLIFGSSDFKKTSLVRK